MQQLGGAVGVAALGTLFWDRLGDVSSPHTETGAFRSAATMALWLAVGLIVLAAALTGLLPRRAREASA